MSTEISSIRPNYSKFNSVTQKRNTRIMEYNIS